MEAEFPYLDENTRYTFPPASKASEHGIVGVGGNLSPGMLLSAYSQGVFPWYSDGEPLLWWNPDPRFVLFPEELHVSRSLAKRMSREAFSYTFDTRFHEVIDECSRIPRPGQEGTWITTEMIDGYCELHRLGYAHSLEVSQGSNLVGSLYGISLGSVFFGESMFARESDASKSALVVLVRTLKPKGLTLVDCQVHTQHLASMGARDIPRDNYLSLLQTSLENPSWKGFWRFPPEG